MCQLPGKSMCKAGSVLALVELSWAGTMWWGHVWYSHRGSRGWESRPDCPRGSVRESGILKSRSSFQV